LSHRQQTLEEVRSFNQVGAVVVPAEWYCFAGCAIHPVRKYSVIMIGIFQEAQNFEKASSSFVTCYPFSFCGYNYCHHSKSGTTDRNNISAFRRLVASFPGEAANRMRKLPEIAERLFLYKFEELFIAKVLLNG
jgi:hypothetical protein